MALNEQKTKALSEIKKSTDSVEKHLTQREYTSAYAELMNVKLQVSNLSRIINL
jgi:hypothetical protein